MIRQTSKNTEGETVLTEWSVGACIVLPVCSHSDLLMENHFGFVAKWFAI